MMDTTTGIHDEGYVDVFDSDSDDSLTLPSNLLQDSPDSLYDQWAEQVSGKTCFPDLSIPASLRRLYPGYSIIMSNDSRLNFLSFPGVHVERMSSSPEVKNVMFEALRPETGDTLRGKLVENVVFGSYRLTSQEREFILFIIKVPQWQDCRVLHFILHQGDEAPIRELMISAMLFQEETHQEIWVFDRGDWTKDKSLWSEVEKASWDGIIMKEGHKQTLKNDVTAFFQSEEIFKEFAIPWKRGLILYGPPGNGKTITIKAIIQMCAERGITPLYVKSLQHCRSKTFMMQEVFRKARQTAPCVLILEDLDSLINDSNRSHFLNQMDGLEGNTGLLIIATTNHLERLDPALASRPSRFDRKYLFDDPDEEERALYAKYWQNKLQSNHHIDFPDSLVVEVACATAGFSFAYLKEAFVSALVQLTIAEDGGRVDFADTLKEQIDTLTKEITKEDSSRITLPNMQPAEFVCAGARHASQNTAEGGVVPSVPEVITNPRSAATATQDTESKTSTVLRIRLDPPTEPVRSQHSQVVSVFPAPLCAYPQAIRPMPGALPGRSTEKSAPRQL